MEPNGSPSLGEVVRRVSMIEEHYVMDEIFAATLLNHAQQVIALGSTVKEGREEFRLGLAEIRKEVQGMREAVRDSAMERVEERATALEAVVKAHDRAKKMLQTALLYPTVLLVIGVILTVATRTK